MEGSNVHSWQRYTDAHPLDCELKFHEEFEMLPMGLTLIPRNELEENTWYVVMLQHGCMLAPVQHINGNLPYFNVDCVSDDYLIPFCTRSQGQLLEHTVSVGKEIEGEREARGASA